MITFAVCSTLNEQDTIGQVVAGMADVGAETIVIDNESEDATVRRALSAGAQVYMTHGRPGLAHALMWGWDIAISQGAQRIIQIDAGGSHNPRHARNLLSGLQRADLVIGSRFCQGGRYIGGPWYRPLVSRMAAAACSQWSGYQHHDWTSGYRVMAAGVVVRLLNRQYRCRMHGWQIETLAHASAMGVQVLEVPITYVAGRSSFNWRVAAEAAGALCRTRQIVGMAP